MKINQTGPNLSCFTPPNRKICHIWWSSFESRDEIFRDSIFNIIRNTGFDLAKEIKFQQDFSFKIYTTKSEYNYLILSCNFAPFVLPELEALYQNYDIDLKSPTENATTQIEFLRASLSVVELIVGMCILFPIEGLIGNVIGVFFVNLI